MELSLPVGDHVDRDGVKEIIHRDTRTSVGDRDLVAKANTTDRA